jgi:Fe2+ or Zn2+ uptake regulation protein
LGGGDHVTADDILVQARTRYPSITPSTIYRTLDTLVEAGIARRTDLGGERLHFEVARAHRHHHVVCQRCGAVEHLHDATLAPLARAIAAATGFVLTPDQEIAIPGLCPACGAAAPAADDERGHGNAHP